MALRSLFHMKNKQLAFRWCSQNIVKRRLDTTSNKGVNLHNECKSDKSKELEDNESYFSSLFYETHPALKEKSKPSLNIKKQPDISNTISNSNNKQHAEPDERIQIKLSSEIVSDDSKSVYTDPFPKDVLESPLDPEVLDSIGPTLPKSFNLAAYANKSKTLQQLIDLGVNLYLVERQGHGQYYLDLDFERDVKNHLLFLKDVGITADDMGTFITRNPLIFKEDIEDLKVRINYLESKKFQKDAIAGIIYKAPAWLSHDTKTIDAKLGTLQKLFQLSGNEVRLLVTKKTKIALSNFQRIREIGFVIQEEMGFTKEETKKILLEKPKIWLLERKKLWERFDYIHNEMKIPHSLILAQPSILLKRKFKIEERHSYLKKLGRAQYDPTKECYVPLQSFAFTKDDVFCEEICKTSVEDFNQFLKTL